jgi:2-aminoethylphosphonate transport system ATP-binding protein
MTELGFGKTRVAAGAGAPAVTESTTPAITFDRVLVRYGRGRKATDALVDFSLRVAAGETVALLGPSGSGKSTALNALAGFVRPTSGAVRLAGRDVTDLPPAKRGIGVVLQSYALFPHMRVADNVAFGLKAQRVPRGELAARIAEALDMVGMSAYGKRLPRELSGGQQQRVAIARALAIRPSVLLLDEPLAALDAPTKSKIIGDLREWNRTHRIPILYVTHSREEVFALGERVIVLDAGRIVAQGTPHEVMTAPTQETVAQLAGFENIFDAEVETVSPERGTMTCRIIMRDSASDVRPILLETPLVRVSAGSALRIGIRAGDILLATSVPVGLSARNVIPGRIQSLEQRDVIVVARVNCGVEMEVHLTLAARDALQLASGKDVWLVIKTHSCHLMQR